MKPFELREMTKPEIEKRLRELKEEYFNLKLQHAVTPISNTSSFKQLRQEIARVKTIQREREMNAY